MKRRRQPAPPPPRPTGRLALVLGLGALAIVAVAAFALWPRADLPPAGADRAAPATGQQTVATGQPAVDANTPGRLVASTEVVDLGRVPFDREVQARYELVNAGGRPIKLIAAPEVKTLEGC
ncbi:MAG: hypothetical protein HY331_09870 [Chloroflexi bacterium]|nr:hypothetical protein [Chloroflexota bacterium]